MAISLHYLSKSGILTARATKAADFLCRQAAAALSSVAMTPALHGGFCNVGWCIAHLAGARTRIPQFDLTELDRLLARHIRAGKRPASPDLLSGLAGFGIYALEASRSQLKGAPAQLLDAVVDRLLDEAESTRFGMTWRSIDRQQQEKTTYDLGVSHGVAGIATFLARASTLPGCVQHSGSLADAARQAGEWIVSHCHLRSRCFGLPTELSANFRPIGPRPQPTWCNGIPGIAAALFNAGAALKHTGFQSAAVRLATDSATRRLDRRIDTPGLCHGSAGLWMIYRRMAAETAIPILGRTAERWLARTLDLLDRHGWDRGRSALDHSLLTGTSGILLALLAAVSPVAPAWDRALLLSG